MLNLLSGYNFGKGLIMSISASIDIYLIKTEDKQYSTYDIIQILIDNGWKHFHNNNVSYQPAGIKEITKWANHPMSIEKLREIFLQKDAACETNGIMMTWQNTEIGGDFLFWPKEVNYKSFSLNLNPFRPIIKLKNDYEIIDFQWYLERLLPPLHRAFGIEAFSFEQQR